MIIAQSTVRLQAASRFQRDEQQSVSRIVRTIESAPPEAAENDRGKSRAASQVDISRKTTGERASAMHADGMRRIGSQLANSRQGLFTPDTGLLQSVLDAPQGDTGSSLNVTGADSPGPSGSSDPALDPKFLVLVKIMEAITGKKMRLQPAQFQVTDTCQDQNGLRLRLRIAPSGQKPLAFEPAVPMPLTDMPLTMTETIVTRRISEQESMHFSAEGRIVTGDGTEIRIGLALNMSRSFVEHSQEHVIALTHDPLVINWNGQAAELTETRFAFDLDSNGQTEMMPFVTPRSGGFLAHDANGDGMVNNGTELFGPVTGNGFQELALHDKDGNHWIDEADPIFHDLSVWTKDESGHDRLIALADTGIGAIYLNTADTPFHLKDAHHRLQGQVRQTGIYLGEAGTPGTIQQVDLAVNPHAPERPRTLDIQA